MALTKNGMVFLLVMALCRVSFGVVHIVGDSDGWTNKIGVDYNTWASTKNIHVGDVLVFKYNPLKHNVMLVNLDDFNSCNPITPVTITISGDDWIPMVKPGNYYYICGFRDHCMAGQKVMIKVDGDDGSMSPIGFNPTPPHEDEDGDGDEDEDEVASCDQPSSDDEVPSSGSIAFIRSSKMVVVTMVLMIVGVVTCFGY